MVRKSSYLLIALLAVIGLSVLCATEAQAGDHHRTSPGLFYNYYVPGPPCGGVGAAMYPSPRPTPPMVGHTYVTYQPLMPHEMLYAHHRTYVRRNPGAGLTLTTVRYRHGLFSGVIGRPPRLLPSPPLPGTFR